jgi:hypothetical protein
MDEFFGLLDERLSDGWIRVTKATNRNAAAEVQEAPVVYVEEFTAAAVAEGNVKPAVAGHDIFGEEFANGLKLIFHDCRRCRLDVFHGFSISNLRVQFGFVDES